MSATAALRPYFQLELERTLRASPDIALRGYAQVDMAHKGDMWNDLHVEGSNGFPRILQPSYTSRIYASG